MKKTLLLSTFLLIFMLQTFVISPVKSDIVWNVPFKITDNTIHDSDPAISGDGTKIAFRSEGGIFVINPDGSGRSQVTFFDQKQPGPPSISNDGTKITFECTEDGILWELYVVNSDGSELTQITQSDGDFRPYISGDGTKIVFKKRPAGDNNRPRIWIVEYNGLTWSDPRRLTEITEEFDNNPSITDDGSKIAFNSGDDIFVMNSDGSGLTQLTDSPNYYTWPQISGDGTKITFTSGSSSEREILVMNSDGTGLIQVSNDSTNYDGDPSINYDGSIITFGGLDESYEIFVVNSDGTGLTALTINDKADYSPTISDDGTKIVFEQLDGDFEIFICNVDIRAPTCSIAINNDELYTTSTSVTLQLTYDDATSGVDQVRYANHGENWGAWEAPSTTKAWTLPSGDGIKPVYYQVRDNAGNLSPQTGDDIILETSPPVITIDVELDAGWNMISFSCLPDDPVFSGIFSDVAFYQVLTWDGASVHNTHRSRGWSWLLGFG